MEKNDLFAISHKSVLVNEVLACLDPQPGKVYLDVTFGAGGHSAAILEKEQGCKVIGLDWDKKSLEQVAPAFEEKYQDRIKLVWGSFVNLYKILKDLGVDKVDGILADFGTSQHQIFNIDGMSFRSETFLDMRMSKAHFQTTAADIVNTASERELADIFYHLGGETYSKAIAKEIVNIRKKQKILYANQLAEIICSIKKGKHAIHPATKIFQALRIFVNKELENIEKFLPQALNFLNSNGKLLCITFHSLEDQIVKTFFRHHKFLGDLEILNPKGFAASTDEIDKNPSSRSAKLRAAQRISDEKK